MCGTAYGIVSLVKVFSQPMLLSIIQQTIQGKPAKE
jgi:hypothetical protein